MKDIFENEIQSVQRAIKQLDKINKMGKTKRMVEDQNEGVEVPTTEVPETRLVEGFFLKKEDYITLVQYVESRPLGEVKEVYNLVINATPVTANVTPTTQP